MFKTFRKRAAISSFLSKKLSVSSIFFSRYIQNFLFSTKHCIIEFDLWRFMYRLLGNHHQLKAHHRQLQMCVQHTAVCIGVDTRLGEFDKQNCDGWKQTWFLYRSRRGGVCLTSACVYRYQWALVYDCLLRGRPQRGSQSNIPIDRVHTRLAVLGVLQYSLKKANS